MGFVRSALLLEWPEESELAGLEVLMRRLSIKQVSRVGSLAEFKNAGTAAEVESAFDELLDAIADGLLSWNYEEKQRQQDGSVAVVAVPADRSGVDRLDIDVVLQLVRAWMKAAAGVPLASKPTSGDGGQPPMPEPPATEEWAAFLGQEQQSPPSSPEPVLS